jgi:hypothetical protein
MRKKMMLAAVVSICALAAGCGSNTPPTGFDSNTKLASWNSQIASAVAGYSGPDAAEIQEAFDNGAVDGQIFPYGPGGG